MAEAFIYKNLADRRKEIQAHIGSLESDHEQVRRGQSAIVATEKVFQSRGLKVTAWTWLRFYPGINCQSYASPLWALPDKRRGWRFGENTSNPSLDKR